MKKIEHEVDKYTLFEFDPFREYEGHPFWSLAKRKKGKFSKGGQVTITNSEEQQTFIEMLKEIIEMYEGGEYESPEIEISTEESEDDVPF